MVNLNHIPIIDFHAHPPREGNISEYCEEGDERLEWYSKIGTYQHSIVNYAAKRYGCERTVEAVDRAITENINTLGFKGHVRSILDRENIEKVNLDFFGAKYLGAPRPSIPGRTGSKGKGNLKEDFPDDRYVWSYNITRIIQPIWSKEKGAVDIDQVLDFLDNDIVESIKTGACALKSMVNYYRALDLEIVNKAQANEAYQRLIQNDPKDYNYIWGAKVPYYDEPNLQKDFKIYQDFIIRETCLIAEKYNIPMIFHTASIELMSTSLNNNDPKHLYSLMSDLELKKVKIVILHGGYPYFRQAAVLPLQAESAGGNVFIDLSYVSSFPSAWRDLVTTVIQFSPIDRIVYGSDGFGLIERTGHSAYWARRMLTEVLDDFIEHYDWMEEECEKAARMILNENAKMLLNIE
jgi:predicted TIM-barrel fold metal-dependent hydrolase